MTTITLGPKFDLADLLFGLAHTDLRVALYGQYLRLIAEGPVTDVDEGVVYVNDQGEETGYAISEVEHIVIGTAVEVILKPRGATT